MKAGQRPTDLRQAILDALQALVSAERREEIGKATTKRPGRREKGRHA